MGALLFSRRRCNWLDTHPRGGALREGPRGGFQALIRAGWRHRADGERVGDRAPKGGNHGQWGAQQREITPKYIIRGISGRKKAESTLRRPEGQKNYSQIECYVGVSTLRAKTGQGRRSVSRRLAFARILMTPNLDS